MSGLVRVCCERVIEEARTLLYIEGAGNHDKYMAFNSWVWIFSQNFTCAGAKSAIILACRRLEEAK